MSIPLEDPAFRLLVLEGSPEEMGFAHGLMLREEIGSFLQDFLYRAEAIIGLPYLAIQTHASELAGQIVPEYAAEMRALSEGAGQPYLDVLGFNTFFDTDALNTQELVHCVNFAVVDSADASGGVYHARNFDFPHENRHWRHSLMICRKPSGGCQPTLSVGWAGQTGIVTGLNQAGLMLSEVSAYPRRFRRLGTPGLLALRKALEVAENLEQGVRALRQETFMAGLNLLLTAGNDCKSLSCECRAEGVEVVPMRGGRLSISGACQSARFARGQHIPLSDAVRHLRTRALLRALPEGFDPGHLLSILGDQHDLWTGRRGRGYRCLCNQHTVHSTLFHAPSGRLWLAAGKPPAPLGGYQVHSLPELLACAPGLHLLPTRPRFAATSP